MDRVAHLIRTAGQIRRMIWASLPFFERFAEVLYRLSSTSQDAFGTGMYQLFAEHGVVGMPDVRGQPVAEFVAKGRPLPGSYGRDFGHRVYNIMIKKFRDAELVQDAMSDRVTEFLKRREKLDLDPGSTLKRAENYVTLAVQRKILDMLRHKKHEMSESSMRSRHDDEDSLMGVLDATPGGDNFDVNKTLEGVLKDSHVRAALKRIHPSAEEYARLMLQGYEDVEILGNEARGKPSMLTHSLNSKGKLYTPSGFTPYKQEIQKVLMAAGSKAIRAQGIAV